MLRFFRFYVLRFGVLFVAAMLRAESSPPAPNATAGATTAAALPPDLQAELNALQSVWHPSAAVRTSLGWRDNVLLSPFTPIERTFARAEVEAMLLRPMRNRWEFISFFNGDVLRYFAPPPESGGEQQWSLHAETRWQPIDAARLSLKGTGYLRDMVIDLSETEARRVVAPTRVRGGYVVASTRVSLPAGFQFEPIAQVKRTDYRDYPGDYDETRLGAKLEWRHRSGATLSAAWFDVDRPYDQRETYSASGRSLAGTHLRFHQRDGEVKARMTWGRSGDWSLAGTVGRLENRDRSSGYFDYDQKRARFEAGWRSAAWRVNLDADAKRMDYLGQTVGSGIAPPTRITDDYETTLRVERDLNTRWSLFGEHRWERSRSNESEFSYRANTVLAGIQRSF